MFPLSYNTIKLDSAYFEPKITAYGRFNPTKEEKQKKQTLYGLAGIFCAANSRDIDLFIRRSDESKHRLFSRPTLMETLPSRTQAGLGQSSRQLPRKKRAVDMANRPAKLRTYCNACDGYALNTETGKKVQLAGLFSVQKC